jgi:hypothetical protein
MELKLNVATKTYAENQQHGLMICGINWGGDPANSSSVDPPSFFSNEAVNRYPYRGRLLSWFSLFGHPLITKEGHEGAFERSIVQTNWLDSQSPNMDNKSLYTECLSQWENLEFHIRTLEPLLIIFLSVSLLETLNSSAILEKARAILCHESDMLITSKEVFVDGKRLKRFRLGFQTFGETQIIALPHPTGSKGLNNKYISMFAPEIYPLIAAYKAKRGFNA